jgi:folate-dependent phosphoribosylglycinamide formyltransferase PurN
MFERALKAIDDGSLDAEIAFVFMQRERGEGEGSDSFMDLAASRRIPVITLSSQRFRRAHDGDFAGHRDEYDAQAVELLRAHQADVCVLAGYLLILSPVLIGAYDFVNLHPALPDGPVGLWQKVIWELIDQHASETGNMTLVVTNDLDRGPQLTFNRVAIKGGAFDALWDGPRDAGNENDPLFSAIRAASVLREPILLVETLKALATSDLRMEDPPSGPLDLTERVEAALRGS